MSRGMRVCAIQDQGQNDEQGRAGCRSDGKIEAKLEAAQEAQQQGQAIDGCRGCPTGQPGQQCFPHALQGKDAVHEGGKKAADKKEQGRGPRHQSQRSPGEREASRLGTHDNVFGHGKDRHQLKVLVDHADAQFDGVVGIGDLDGGTTDLDLAFVLGIEAVEDIHQGAFARAVFAQEGQDLALFQRKADAVVGQHPREAFGDVAHLKIGAIVAPFSGYRYRVSGIDTDNPADLNPNTRYPIQQEAALSEYPAPPQANLFTRLDFYQPVSISPFLMPSMMSFDFLLEIIGDLVLKVVVGRQAHAVILQGADVHAAAGELVVDHRLDNGEHGIVQPLHARR